MRKYGLHAVEHALHIQIERPVEQFIIDVQELRPAQSSAGRIEQEVHLAECIDGMLDHIRHLPVRDVTSVGIARDCTPDRATSSAAW